MKISAISEDSVLITLADAIDDTLPLRIARLCKLIESDGCQDWLVDLVPSYTTLLVIYDPVRTDFHRVMTHLRRSLQMDGKTAPESLSDSQSCQVTREIPVYYGLESGPDLEWIARENNLGVEDVIDYHTDATYTVYAMGFAPGFAFMGQVDPAIATPRKDTPRSHVPAGSVGIANRQTAVYPKASPGGWQLIGKSPVKLFDSINLSLLNVGDRVRFRSITRQQFIDMGGEL